jgi:acetolactate synthase-1/2/3 large subunit
MEWSLKMSPEKTICVNSNPFTLGSHPNGNAVVGDVGAYLRWLGSREDQICESLEESRKERMTWLAGIKAHPRLQDQENLSSDAIPIHPARVIGELRKVFPRDGILLTDAGAHRAFSGHYWESYQPRTYISATNLGPMGWAIPAAVGVQCAKPGRKVAVITGDGCMRMHGMEVATAARYNLPVVYVVINNGALGNVWLRAHNEGVVPEELTTLPDIDWAGFAAALGAEGITITKPEDLAGAFEKALRSKKPVVIDVKADKRFGTPVKDWSLAAAAWSYHE